MPTYEVLPPDEHRAVLDRLPGWTVEGARLRKTFRLADFKQALAFTVQVGCLAEQADHHPDIALSWGRVGIELWTHDVGGLTRHDVRLAERIEAIPLS